MRRQPKAHRRGRRPAHAARAGLWIAAGLTGALALCRLHPGVRPTALTPDAAVVLGCAWLAWAMLGYLAASIAIAGAIQLVGALGASTQALARLAGLVPRRVRWLVDRTVVVGLTATVLGTAVAAPAGALSHHGSTAPGAGRLASAGALDWPGLRAAPQTALGTTHQRHPHPVPSPSRHVHRRSAPSRPVHQRANGPGRPDHPPAAPARHAAAPMGAAIVVRPGDSLWSIAAAHLPGDASVAATTRAWHELYDANRSRIGTDPDLIHPGQRLADPLGSGEGAER